MEQAAPIDALVPQLPLTKEHVQLPMLSTKVLAYLALIYEGDINIMAAFAIYFSLEPILFI
jgi:hypothetical protein